MKKILKRMLGGILILFVIAIVTLGVTISYDSDCVSPPPVTDGETTMSAVVQPCYGPPEILELVETARPEPDENELLIKIEAAAINPLDWHAMRGSPYLMRLGSGTGAPNDIRFGVDFAGTVEVVGTGVTRFKPGDRVFGGTNGAFAEYTIRSEESAVAKIPDNVSFEQAAAVPIAALTALQALRDKGEVKAGQKVLINGASGGVGTFAVQIAKSYGAEVSGVCSTRNVEMVRAIGADHVFDYKTEDYTESGEQFDLITS